MKRMRKQDTSLTVFRKMSGLIGLSGHGTTMQDWEASCGILTPDYCTVQTNAARGVTCDALESSNGCGGAGCDA